MRLLLDQNLSPRLVAAVADLYPGSGQVPTWAWRLARASRIVSKDAEYETEYETGIDTGIDMETEMTTM